MKINPNLPILATLLASLFIVSFVILLSLDKQIPEYMSIAFASLVTYLFGVFTKYPEDRSNQ